MEHSLEDKIENLVRNRAINIRTKELERKKYRACRLLPLARREEPGVGDFCRSIVIGKDQSKKELILHIIYLIDEKEDDELYINHLKMKGFIYDYDLKQEFSIFTYVGTYKQITLGTQILAQVRSITHRDNQKYYEMTLKYKKNERNSRIIPGIKRDQVGIGERDWKIYKKYGCFSGTFLAQYQQQFANPGLFNRYCNDLQLRDSESLSKDSLIPHLDDLSLDFQRVRQVQEKEWADKHFMEGLSFLKAGQPQISLEHLTLAKSFEKKSSKILVARGCALANLHNFHEGLKQIKEALRLSPDNKEALEYQERIKKEMRAKDRKDLMIGEDIEEKGKKVRLTNSLQLIKRK